jgi:hypothetical protein
MKRITPHDMNIKIKTLAPLGAALFLASNSYAAVIASDSFETTGTDAYSVDRLYGQSPTDGLTGFSGSTAWGGPFNTGDISINATGLTASLAAGSTGGSVVAGGAATNRVDYRTFDSFTPTNETYYFSFLFSVESGATAGARSAFGISAGSSTEQDDPTSGVMLGINQTGTAEGTLSLWVAGNEFAFTGSDAEAGDTYFALFQIDNVDGNDTVTANIYSSTATDFSTSLASATTSDYDISSQLAALEVQKDFGGNTIKFDEFYLGTSLSDVSSIPEPSTFAMLAGFCAFTSVFMKRRRNT